MNMIIGKNVSFRPFLSLSFPFQHSMQYVVAQKKKRFVLYRFVPFRRINIKCKFRTVKHMYRCASKMINGHKTLKNWWIQMRNNVFASASTALNWTYLHTAYNVLHIPHYTITHCLHTMHMWNSYFNVFPSLRTNYASLLFVLWMFHVPCFLSPLSDINSWRKKKKKKKL